MRSAIFSSANRFLRSGYLARLGLSALLVGFSAHLSQAQDPVDNPTKQIVQHWVSTWAVSPQTQDAPAGYVPTPADSFSDQTLRQIIHTSIGGSHVRVRLSNQFGTDRLVIGEAGIGLRTNGPQIDANSYRALTFSGRPSVSIAPGALVVSDPIDLEVPPLGDLAISIYLPNPTLNKTLHFIAAQTNYLAAGDQTTANVLTNCVGIGNYFFLKSVEVVANPNVGAVVCLGDSITDGAGSTADTNRRWPNFFAQRLQSMPGSSRKLGVINQGIGGNRLCHNATGPDILSRFDSDVVAQVGVTDVILLAGINDIGLSGVLPNEIASADDIVVAYRQIIARAHEAGLKIYGGTLTPFGGQIPPYYSDEGEAKRAAVNEFIRNSGEFDGVIDFEAAVRDTNTPPRLLPQYDSGDHLHPNDSGYEAMAAAIKLRYFKKIK